MPSPPLHKHKATLLMIFWLWFCINTLATSRFQGFLRKKHRNACGFAWEFLQSGKRYRPGQKLKRRSKSCSLHSEKNFVCGMQLFCEGRHKWRAFRPSSPGPGLKLSDGSILLKFLLETRLQSEFLIFWMTCWGFSKAV